MTPARCSARVQELRQRARTQSFCDLRTLAAGELLSSLADRNAMGASIRCMCWSAIAAFSCSCRGREPRGDLSAHAYFSSHSTSWLAHAEACVAGMTGRLGLGRPVRSSRSPATTAICCSISCSAACRCSASSRRPTSRRWRWRRACRVAWRSLASTPRRRCSPGHPGRPARQQRAGARAEAA